MTVKDPQTGKFAASKTALRARSERWLAEREAAGLTEATIRAYRTALRSFAADLGSREPEDLTRPEARSWALAAPRGYIPAVRTFFNDLVRDGVLSANPFADLRLAQSNGRRHEKPPSEEDIALLGAKAVELYGEWGKVARGLIYFAGFVGARPGESFALKWPALDLKAGRVEIVKQFDGTAERNPKRDSTRTVTVPPPACAALAELIQPDGYVFYAQRGGRLYKSLWHRPWAKIRAAAGLDCDFYLLRHSAATIMLERGATPEDVAFQLGHSDSDKLVRLLYGHPSEEGRRERLEELWDE